MCSQNTVPSHDLTQARFQEIDRLIQVIDTWIARCCGSDHEIIIPDIKVEYWVEVELERYYHEVRGWYFARFESKSCGLRVILSNAALLNNIKRQENENRFYAEQKLNRSLAKAQLLKTFAFMLILVLLLALSMA